MATPYTAYNRASHTVSQTRQVVMLYEGAIRFLQQAGEAMVAGDPQTRFLRLNRASEIVLALQSALDLDIGGALGQGLNDFYSAIDRRITHLHRSNDRTECTRIVEELRSMRDMWDAIDRGEHNG